MASEQSLHTNRLSKEKSPYLLQHAHNPVDWFAWSDEAFEKARVEDKPIFLSIGYSTCHWCHVMERESFEDPGTAKLLNEHFVSIKVDREERPDLDAVYMSYVQASTGSGGWPMSVFLTPDKKPFYGGTYFPPEDRWGMPGFPTLLKSLADSWKTRRAEILESADSAVKFLRAQDNAPASRKQLSAATLEEAFKRFEAGFDEEHGGFGRAPKFPRSHALSFLMRYWLRTKNDGALRIAEKTLKEMAAGGMYDQLGGGFHRYSTDGLWRIPHFEKMLYDQALLVLTYVEVYQATGKAGYARVARETLDYVLTRMTSSEGAFYSAEDADSADPRDLSHKREGAYYVWQKTEIEKALGADADAFNSFYGVVEAGNALADPHHEFEEQNVLYRKEIEAAPPKGKAALLNARARRLAPHLDDKVLTDWNSLMISAFARAGIVLDEPRYREAARRAAVFLDTHLRDSGKRLLHRFRDGEAAVHAHLSDQAFFLGACLDVYEATFDGEWLLKAQSAADRMLADFSDNAGGGFYLTAGDGEVLISRPKEIYDGAVPSGNSAAAMGLLRLSRLLGEERYEKAARRTIDAFAERIANDPSNMPAMLMALDFALGPSREVTIGGPSAEAAREFLEIAQKPFFPNQVVMFKQGEGKTTAIVCRDGVCRLPVSESEALKKLLGEK